MRMRTSVSDGSSKSKRSIPTSTAACIEANGSPTTNIKEGARYMTLGRHTAAVLKDDVL